MNIQSCSSWAICCWPASRCAHSQASLRPDPDARGFKRQKTSVLFESFQRDSRVRSAHSGAVMPISHRLNDSVALAAIQGLNQKLENDNHALRTELKLRDALLADLERRLAAIEQRNAPAGRQD